MQKEYSLYAFMHAHDSRMSAAEKWADWIGRTTTAEAVLDPCTANRLAATLDWEPSFEVDSLLPYAWHWLYFQELVAASGLGPDGHPRPGITMPPAVPPRRMWAAGRIDFVAPLRLGRTATRSSTIKSITPKDGRTGPLVFVTIDHALHVDGETAVLEEQSVVYREPAAPSGGDSPAAPLDADFSDTWQLDNAALFRYSALTFNSHRIHYDADYARDVEGYPGLVVHGPLLVTLLLHVASSRGIDLASVRYRAVSPVFLPDAFTVNGRRDERELALWATSASGHLAMNATAITTDTTQQEIDR